MYIPHIFYTEMDESPEGMWLQNWGFGNKLAKLGDNLIIIWQLFGNFGN
jgi:hypothetical protein